MITVLGLGFVGLTTGLGFSKKGFTTYGFDIDAERLRLLKEHKIPFHEPHLQDVLKDTLGKTFFLDVSFEEAIKKSEAVFICVGTPSAPDGSADLKYIIAAIDQIIDVDDDQFKVIITKSTVPPSTVSKKVKPHVEKRTKELNRNVGLASNPEFLREGYCWEDFIEPDRIVLGVEDEKSEAVLTKIYQPFGAPIHFVSYNSAEFIKYLSNTLLSTLISYSNEMSMIANAIGDIDIATAFKIIHEDKRWTGEPAAMQKYVYPGCGYGGYCLPKDTSALDSIAKEYGVTPHMLTANLKINQEIKPYIVDRIMQQVSKEATIGILGLAFKPESDDVRLSPSKYVIENLINHGYTKILAYDPVAIPAFQSAYPEFHIEYFSSLENLLQKTNNLVIATAWNEFKEKKNLIQENKVFDLRYIY